MQALFPPENVSILKQPMKMCLYCDITNTVYHKTSSDVGEDSSRFGLLKIMPSGGSDSTVNVRIRNATN